VARLMRMVGTIATRCRSGFSTLTRAQSSLQKNVSRC
jgi:hypothetical protein